MNNTVKVHPKVRLIRLWKLLSGGNQQKLIIARELNDHAKVIVVLCLTEVLTSVLSRICPSAACGSRNAGKGVALISADLEEIWH